MYYFLIQKDYTSFTKFTKKKNEQLLFLNKIMMNKTYKIENNINNNILDSSIIKDKSYLLTVFVCSIVEYLNLSLK